MNIWPPQPPWQSLIPKLELCTQWGVEVQESGEERIEYMRQMARHHGGKEAAGESGSAHLISSAVLVIIYSSCCSTLSGIHIGSSTTTTAAVGRLTSVMWRNQFAIQLWLDLNFLISEVEERW